MTIIAGDTVSSSVDALTEDSAGTSTVLVKVDVEGGNITFDLPSDDDDTIIIAEGSYPLR